MYAFSSLFFKNGQNFQMFDWEAVTLRTKIIELKSASYSGGFPYQEGRQTRKGSATYWLNEN